MKLPAASNGEFNPRTRLNMSTIKTEQKVKTLSNRVFGLIFAGIFLVIALWPLMSGGGPRTWALIAVVFFTIPALLMPKLLTPLNAAWVKFGLLMHKIVNPILMGLIFFLTVLPTGMMLRVFGKDPMRRKLDTKVDSYWQERSEKISKDSFDNQF